MAYVNCFIRVMTDGRDVSVGGRRAQDDGQVWINTATAEGERDLTITAEVCGNLRAADRRRSPENGGGDNREAQFDIELPKPGGCKVRLMRKGGRMGEVVKMGALLVAAKGVLVQDENPEHSAQCLEFSRETLDELERQATDHSLLPDVELPGGVSLARALACVALVDNQLAHADTATEQ